MGGREGRKEAHSLFGPRETERENREGGREGERFFTFSSFSDVTCTVTVHIPTGNCISQIIVFSS